MADIKIEKIDPKADNKPKVDLGLLEEDDEFEEFPADGECGIPLLLHVYKPKI